jgi:hypothetical protein
VALDETGDRPLVAVTEAGDQDLIVSRDRSHLPLDRTAPRDSPVSVPE